MADGKSLLDLANEADETKYQEGVKTLTDAEKTEVEGLRTIRAERKKEEEARDAARAAKRQQEELAEDARKRTEAGNLSFEQRMRKENSDKALNQIYKDLGVEKEEEKEAIKKEFEARKPESVTVENLVLEARKAAASAFPDKFIGAFKALQDRKAGAADFNSSNAGSFGGSEDEDEDTKKYSKEAKQVQADAKKQGVDISLDDAQAYVDEGGLRGVRRFELGKKSREKS